MTNSNLWPMESIGSLTPRGDVSRGVEALDGPWSLKLRDGTLARIRPIRDDDEGLERRFIETLSPESSRFRFLGQIKSPSPQFLTQLTHLDHASEVAFIAVVDDDSREIEVGVSRYCARSDGLSCECAVVVGDGWQRQGLATALMQHLIDVARRRGVESMYSLDAADNHAMRELADHLGFTRRADPDDSTLVVHTLDLNAGP